MYEAGKGDKQRPTDHEAYANNYDAIFSRKKRSDHVVKYQGNSSHNNEDWYVCINCGAKDWIAPGYGLLSQLSFYDKPCTLEDVLMD